MIPKGLDSYNEILENKKIGKISDHLDVDSTLK